MLAYLSVKNVSVIESVAFELREGLTVITGETGSGKSVLVNSLKLLLGDRFQRGMLREGADKLVIEGIFTGLEKIPNELKEPFDIEDELVIRREANEAGKNRIFINGILASAAQLKEFAPYLADIHAQHEYQSLTNPAGHLPLLDSFVSKEVLSEYTESYEKYLAAKRELEKLKKENEEAERYRDLLEVRFKEIQDAEIDLKRDSELEERVNYISHRERIREGVQSAYESIAEGEINAEELVTKGVRALSGISSVSRAAAEAAELLSSALENLNEAERILSPLVLQEEEEDLDKLVQRKYLLQELMKKYGGSLENVLSKGEETALCLRNLKDGEHLLSALDKALTEAEVTARKAAEKLLGERISVSERLSGELKGILGDLELAGTEFKTVFAKLPTLNESGGVTGEFYISVNKGFEPAPLAQIASGGEVSRVMLAITEIFSSKDSCGTILFDEIDTGISGRTAKKVAEKLAKLSESKQVLSITHLPVVAAKGDTHIHIHKISEGDKTKTIITLLSEAERPSKLAAMIAGDVTEASLKQAKELLESK
ncbi:MAG: DNA repair protein RecN [Deferribacteraceae bacterium]|jgi:DNA repair protein RecN (Recombination protein N)|nr:DNA repair protein RecN [Deferribacteraceae bacterium]